MTGISGQVRGQALSVSLSTAFEFTPERGPGQPLIAERLSRGQGQGRGRGGGGRPSPGLQPLTPPFLLVNQETTKVIQTACQRASYRCQGREAVAILGQVNYDGHK